VRLASSEIAWLSPERHPKRLPAAAQARLAGVVAAERRRRGFGLALFALGVGLGALSLFRIFLEAPLAAGDSERMAAMLLGATLAFPAAVVYATVPRLLDRFDPEPWYALLGCVVWGALAAGGLSALTNTAVATAVAAERGSDAGQLVATVVSAPIAEELWKGLGVVGVFLFLRREFDGVIDGIVYATFTAIGFAAVENVAYYASQAPRGREALESIFLLRGVLSPWCHPVFASMTGIGLGVARETTKPVLRWLAPVLGFVLAVGLHAIWNGLRFALSVPAAFLPKSGAWPTKERV
jgi:RsiW-degrading membrane proteinase PrsW (M82 family)